MAAVRKDSDGRILRKGEYVRSSDGRIAYDYTDPLGRRRTIYGRDLIKLREKEDEIKRDQLDGLDVYVRGQATLNTAYDRYISTKVNLRGSTIKGYAYSYERYVRNTFGNKKLADIKYSDVLQFYLYLLKECNLALGTLDSIHCVIHPTLQLAVRDDIIRKNPSDGVIAEISKSSGKNKGIRHIPMLEVVKIALQMIKDKQEEQDITSPVLEGMTGFLFLNRFGNVMSPQSVNRAIKRIIASYNHEEELDAKCQKREPLMLQDFSCHHLRHTFATRLCNSCTNQKVIQYVMGHKCVTTTFDIYAEATEDKNKEVFELLSDQLQGMF